VWSISRFDLGPQLIAMQDGASHISIGPAGAMKFANFEALVESTAPKWVKVEKC
jgi:hypothetical protein